MSEENEVKTEVKVDREKYVEARTASGTKSLHNGDTVAETLAGLPIDAIHSIGTEVLDEDTSEKYGHLNVGMQRMNVGNRIRGFINAKKLPEGETAETRAAYVAGVAEPHAEAAKEAAEAREAEKEAKAAEKAEAAEAAEAE